MVAEPVVVRVGGEAPVLRPLDLSREVAGGPEAERTGSELPIRRSSSAFEGRIRPGSPSKWRSSASAAEWKVEARTPSAPSARSRARSSPAALSVNVTATICSGGKAPLATCHAIRRVIVVVFPVPAPARMHKRTARRLHGSALLGVQPCEDPFRVQVAEASDGTGRGPSRKRQVFVSTRGSISSM